jgi:hypothetical protein
MDTPSDQEARAVFDYFSREYAQALQAIGTIEEHAPTLIGLGSTGELSHFITTFIEMAERTRKLAETQNEANFADWFSELIARANAIAAAMDANTEP